MKKSEQTQPLESRITGGPVRAWPRAVRVESHAGIMHGIMWLAKKLEGHEWVVCWAVGGAVCVSQAVGGSQDTQG